jgi:hypothetical protein
MTYVIVNITYVMAYIGYAANLHTPIPKPAKPTRIKTF